MFGWRRPLAWLLGGETMAERKARKVQEAQPHSVHVVWSGGEWKVKAGGLWASGPHPTKRIAISAGRRLAKELKAELKIHNMDGRIGDSVSYGNDPRGTPG